MLTPARLRQIHEISQEQTLRLPQSWSDLQKEAHLNLKRRIAAGLAQAAIACANIDQQAALLIQEAVASFQDGAFQASLAAVAGDLSTAATAAATGSAGSVIVTNPNTSTGPNSTLGGGGAVSALVMLTTAAVTSNTTTATPAADAVSATR
jgi:hypothetical protein